ncbi:MAG: NYN domain-containing protein [Chitinophagaceae bacterium]|nr:NYN domain-containing protein [Chitinophagaceae bacterium]
MTLSTFETNQDLKLAVLIDADNIPYARIKAMLEEIAKYGTPTFKRIYGDWTRPNLSGWKTVLLENAITPIQQYSYTKGKNSTDSALIIDAMDILYTGKVDGFCIISSDSDFTRLATRLREAGMKVFGMGEKKTPVSFIASCNKFIYIEILDAAEDTVTAIGSPALINTHALKSATSKPPAKAKRAAPTKKTTSPPPTVIEEMKAPVPAVSAINEDLIKLIRDSISDLAEEDGWAGLAQLGSLLIKKQPDFDPRNYGFKKLVSLIKNIPAVETDERITGKNSTPHIYVRIP